MHADVCVDRALVNVGDLVVVLPDCAGVVALVLRNCHAEALDEAEVRVLAHHGAGDPQIFGLGNEDRVCCRRDLARRVELVEVCYQVRELPVAHVARVQGHLAARELGDANRLGNCPQTHWERGHVRVLLVQGLEEGTCVLRGRQRVTVRVVRLHERAEARKRLGC